MEKQHIFSKNVRMKLQVAGEACKEIVQWFNDCKQACDLQEKDLEDREFFEREKLKDNIQPKRLEEKLALEMETVNYKFEIEQLAKPKVQTETKPIVKMPYLQVAEFSGEPLDWL